MNVTNPRAGLGARVRELRRRANMTQEEFAELLGRNQVWVSDLERGVGGWPEPELLREMAAVLGTDTADLLRAAGYLAPAGPGDDGDARPSAVEIYTMAMEQVQSDDDLMPEERDAILSALRLAHSIRRQRRGGRD